MDTLAEFLGLLSAVKPAKDDKLQALIRLLKTDHLRPLQAPAGISPVLKCWMELN